MKKAILIALILSPVFAASQSWQWASKIGGSENKSGAPFYVDNNNDFYVAGSFNLQGYFQTDTLISNGYSDCFLTKYNSSGNELWIKQFGGNNPLNTNEILFAKADNSGNFLFAVGSFYDTLTIDSHSVISVGNSDIFIAKFDLNGSCQWLKRAGGIASDIGGVFSFDSNNNIFITGEVNDTAQFNSYIVPPGNFFAKYDQNANCLWALNKYSGLNVYDVKLVGNMFFLSGTTINNLITLDNITASFNKSLDAFIAQVDTGGSAMWIKRYGTYSNTYGISFDVDNQNNIYFTGYFEDSASFGNVTIYHNPPTWSDFFIAKLNSIGNAIWVEQSNSSGGNIGTTAVALKSDGDGNVYITGTFSGNANFGNFNITSSTNADMFVARYNTNGVCLGVRNFGTATGGRFVTDNNENIIIGGKFINTVIIGSQSLTSTNNLFSDIFIAKSDGITSIPEAERSANNQLIIYANPNAGKCNITIPNEFQHEKKLSLSIFANNGKLIQQIPVEMNESKIKLNLQTEPKGIYTVTLTNGKKNYYGKIVFE